MAICFKPLRFVSPLYTSGICVFGTQSLRCVSSTAIAGNADLRSPASKLQNEVLKESHSLARLKTTALLRRLLMCTFLTSPALYQPGLAAMRLVANSNSPLLNPDKNFILQRVMKPLVYDQFCAGRHETEIRQTVAGIKSLGFSGVILCYGKEALIDGLEYQKGVAHDPELLQWKNGTLETLDMIGSGDWLGIKMTGAGQKVMRALLSNGSPTTEFMEAMDAICKKALKQGCRVYIDAEQQAVQKAIDRWTIDLMRKWNTGSQPLVYNTLQSYLKQSRQKLKYQLELAQSEGWILALKLVRGAYIAHDRAMVHVTKAETDQSYEGIVRDLLMRSLPELSSTNNFPRVELLLAGHNIDTISKAYKLAKQLAERGQLYTRPEFAQLQGMADNIGCALLHQAAQTTSELSDRKEISSTTTSSSRHAPYVPRVYKCLTWGSIQECMQYLVRRAIENRGVTERIRDDASMYTGELRRRFWGMFSRMT